MRRQMWGILLNRWKVRIKMPNFSFLRAWSEGNADVSYFHHGPAITSAAANEQHLSQTAGSWGGFPSSYFGEVPGL